MFSLFLFIFMTSNIPYSLVGVHLATGTRVVNE